MSLGAGVVATASAGALVPGWTLVLAPGHSTSSARLPLAERLELFAKAEALRRLLADHFSLPVVLFEHGSVDELSPMACTTSHTHLHLVPIAGDVFAHASHYHPLPGDWEEANVASLRDWSEIDYLLFQDENGPLLVHPMIEPVSQYFRRVIASMTGVPERWDWRLCETGEFVRLTRTTLRRLASITRHERDA